MPRDRAAAGGTRNNRRQGVDVSTLGRRRPALGEDAGGSGDGRELWKSFRVSNLRSGDMVSISCTPTEVSPRSGSWSNKVADKIYFPEKVFRRVDPADDPRVLRRALEIASSQLLEAMHAMMERKSPKPSVKRREALHR